MNSEEFYHIDMSVREVRISSLHWVWDNLNINSGSIRVKTIIELIPYPSLVKLLSELESDERYEDCKVVWDIMKLYGENEKRTNDTTNPFDTNRRMEDWG